MIQFCLPRPPLWERFKLMGGKGDRLMAQDMYAEPFYLIITDTKTERFLSRAQ
jgi:hypothetical protein